MWSMKERLGAGPPWNSSASATRGALLFAGIVHGRLRQVSLSHVPLRAGRTPVIPPTREAPPRANAVPVHHRSVSGAPDPEGGGGERVLERYFPDQPQRRTFVRVEETCSSLILETDGDGAPGEQADLPPAQAEALLAVSRGQVEYRRTRLAIGSYEIQALQFVRPNPLDLTPVISVPEDGEALPPLPGLARRSVPSRSTGAGA